MKVWQVAREWSIDAMELVERLIRSPAPVRLQSGCARLR